MTTKRKTPERTIPGEHESRPGVTYHPRSPDASLKELERLAGMIKLTAPVPWREWLNGADDEDDEDERAQRAGQ